MKKQITFEQLKKLVKEGIAPQAGEEQLEEGRPAKRPARRAKAPEPLKEKFIIHYTDNARCRERGGGHDMIDDYEFVGTLQDVLNFGAYAMNGGDIDEDMFQDACNGGDSKYNEWEMKSIEDAKDFMDTADLGMGDPVVFWIKNSKGKKVYDSGISDRDWLRGYC